MLVCHLRGGISCVTTACVCHSGTGKKVKLSLAVNGSGWSAACTDDFTPSTRAPIMNRRLGWPQEAVWTFCRRKNLLPLPGIASWFPLSSSPYLSHYSSYISVLKVFICRLINLLLKVWIIHVIHAMVPKLIEVAYYEYISWDLKFLQQWLWRVLSSGMSYCVVEIYYLLFYHEDEGSSFQ
jgi:hypothetical protein